MLIVAEKIHLIKVLINYTPESKRRPWVRVAFHYPSPPLRQCLCELLFFAHILQQ